MFELRLKNIHTRAYSSHTRIIYYNIRIRTQRFLPVFMIIARNTLDKHFCLEVCIL